MNLSEKSARRRRYVTSTLTGENVRAFVPAPLPPNTRTLDIVPLQAILAEANQAVGRLDGLTSAFPDPKLFLYSYVRKEAVLSSQIEGTQSFPSDLLLYENSETPGVPLDDVQEVSNYLAALNHAEVRPEPLRCKNGLSDDQRAALTTESNSIDEIIPRQR